MKTQRLSNQIVSRTEKLEKITKDAGISFEEFDNLKYLIKKENFDIAFIGEFSTGKSSLINAILEEELLPTNLDATTAIITYLYYSEKPEIRVIYKDGTEKSFKYSPEILSTLVATNIKEISEIKEIHILSKNPFLEKGIRIIDTPGTNDIDEIRVQLTYDILPKVDAVIYVSTYPITKTNIDFFEQYIVKNGIANLFFVLNKMDLYSKEESHVIINETKKCFIEKFNIEIDKFYDVSAYDYSEGVVSKDNKLKEISNVTELVKSLTHFIKGTEKFLNLSKQYNYLIEKIKEQVSSIISSKIAGVSFSEDEFKEKKEKLFNELNAVNKKEKELVEFVIRYFEEINNKYDTILEEEFSKYPEEISLLINNTSEDLRKLKIRLEQNLNDFLAEFILLIENQRIKDIKNISDKINPKIAEMLNQSSMALKDFTTKAIVQVDDLKDDSIITTIALHEPTTNVTAIAGSIAGYLLLTAAHVAIAPLALVSGYFIKKYFNSKLQKEKENLISEFKEKLYNVKSLIRQDIFEINKRNLSELLSFINMSISGYNKKIKSEIEIVENLRTKKIFDAKAYTQKLNDLLLELKII